MTTLHLGVEDVPYRHEKGEVGSRTTGEVAEILEHKYHIIGAFWKRYGKKIGDEVTQSILGALESLHMGHVTTDPTARAMSATENMFRKFIESGEVERVGIPGTPTQAALKGISHRFKHPYAKRGRRVSFYDTGLYESSFRAWTSGDNGNG